MKVVIATIFAKEPNLRLKKKKLGPTVDLKEGMMEMAIEKAMEIEGEEEEDAPCLVQKRMKTTASRKRK